MFSNMIGANSYNPDWGYNNKRHEIKIGEKLHAYQSKQFYYVCYDKIQIR